MARVVYSEQALSDFERLADFFVEHEPALATTAVAAIVEAIAILERHPFIGRPVEHELRELVISRGKTGYLALYAFLEGEDVALVLALRHQREAGYLEAPTSPVAPKKTLRPSPRRR